MKIAMVTGGQPRFRHGWLTNITSLVGEHTIHLYMNLWKDYGKAKPFNSQKDVPTEHNIIDMIVKDLPVNCILKKFSQIDTPKFDDIVPEEVRKLPRASSAVPTGDEYLERFYMQHFGLWSTYSMIDEEYDCIIRYRLDGQMEYKIDINNLDLKKAIYIPDNLKYSEHPSLWPEINDQYAIGNMENMEVYLRLFEHMTNYFIEDTRTIHLETCLSYHLQKYGIKINSAGFQYRLNR